MLGYLSKLCERLFHEGGGHSLRIRVKTPSRLHFGIVDLSGSLGRSYGALGLAIDEPGYEIVAERSEKFGIEGEDKKRVREIASRVARLYGLSTDIKVHVLQSIPRHVGLGSTTQLTLAVGKALTELHGLKIHPVELAEKTGRGKNSGVGTYAFAEGGFIVDGGRKNGFPPLILRRDFPGEWRFVVATPGVGRGLGEGAEEKLFKRVKSPAWIAREISHLLVMKMLPSMVERDIENFGQALTEVDGLVGKAFSPYQKGKFHSKVVSDTIDCMLKHGAHGAGQSSWGPTAYGLVGGDAHASELRGEVEEFLREKGYTAVVGVARPNNTGARVKTET